MKLSIQTKVIAVILLLGILLIGALTVVSNVFFSRVMEDQVMPLSRGSVGTLALNLRLHSYTYLSVTRNLTLSPEVAALADCTYTDAEQKDAGKKTLARLLSETNYWERAAWPAKVLLLCRDGTILTDQSYSHGDFMGDVRDSLRRELFYHRLINATSTVTWMGVLDNPLSSAGRPQMVFAQNVVRDRAAVGVMICMVDAAYYAALMSHGQISALSDIYLVSQNGDIIVADGTGQRTLEQLQAVEQQVSGERVMLGQDLYVCLRENIDFPDYEQQWELVLLHPVQDLMRELNSMQTTVVVIGGILILALLCVLVYINRIVLRPLVYYRRKIAQIRTDNFDVQIDAVGTDEVRDLGEGLKTMVARIKTGMETLRDRENTLRKLEIQTLTAQINPHFIRNTLNSVRVMAEMSGTPVLAEAIRTFTRLIDYIFHGDRKSTVAGELAYLQDYMDMQNLRWQHKFFYRAQVEPALLEEPIPALILQPIVENSITHGFWGRKGSGEILLTGYTDGQDMVFVVEDDGVGIVDPNVLESNKNAPHGLSNIQSRLRLLYGEGYGLQIQKRPVGGTAVTVRIPKGGTEHAEDHDRG